MEKLRRCTELLQQAVALDQAGDAVPALALYDEGLGLMIEVIRAERNPAKRSKWSEHMQQYLTRAEELKKTTEAGKQAADSSPDPAASPISPPPVAAAAPGLVSRLPSAAALGR